MKYRQASRAALLLAAAASLSCADPEPTPEDAWTRSYPGLIVVAEDKARLLDRLDRAPYARLLTELQASADRDYRSPELGDWDHSAHGHNATVAQDAAFLAWLLDDADYAQKALDGLPLLDPDLDSSTDWDVNIRAVRPIMGYSNAYDLLMGAGVLPEAEGQALREAILSVTDDLFERYVEDDVTRQIALGVSQNNHPIRTASAVAYAALAFPDHPQAQEWLDWSLSELSYLHSPEGRYIQSDGGVSEGPFYFGYGYAAAVAAFIAARTTAEGGGAEPNRVLSRDCRNRQDVEPWAPNTCVEGEPFVFDNPLFAEGLRAAVDWSIGLRLPDGLRPPLADGYFNPLNGAALLTGFGGAGHTLWDWQSVVERPYETQHGNDLLPHHLAWVDDQVAVAPPPWTSRVLPEAGTAALRSGWDADARWLLLVAEAGAARQTLHDHVDGLSFSMAAYGDYLLVDPGYYKPNTLNNAVTSAPEAHNVVLIDGLGAPDKGLLTDFGDADAFIERAHLGETVEVVGARQSYQEADLQRDVLFVRGRYFIVLDRIDTARTEPREHAWRLGGFAGLDEGGFFERHEDGATWEREVAGVRVYLATTEGALRIEEPPLVEGEPPHVHQLDLSRTVGHHAVIDGVSDAVSPGFLAVLAPYALGEQGARGPLVVEALELPEGAVGWRVTGESNTDYVLLREADAPTAFSVDGVGVVLTAEAAFWGEGVAVVWGEGALEVNGEVLGESAGELGVSE